MGGFRAALCWVCRCPVFGAGSGAPGTALDCKEGGEKRRKKEKERDRKGQETPSKGADVDIGSSRQVIKIAAGR